MLHVGVRPDAVPDCEFAALLQVNPLKPSAEEAVPERLRTDPLPTEMSETPKFARGACVA